MTEKISTNTAPEVSTTPAKVSDSQTEKNKENPQTKNNDNKTSENKTIENKTTENKTIENKITENQTPETKEKKEGESYFVPIYGENPSEETVLRTLKERSTAYKDCKTYAEANAIVEKNNPDLFKWLQSKNIKSNPKTININNNKDDVDKNIHDPKWVADPKNQADVDKYLEELGYTPDGKKVKDNTEDERRAQMEKKKKEVAQAAQAKKEQEIEAKKKELLAPTPIPSKPIIWNLPSESRGSQEKSSEITPPPKEATQPEPKIEKTKAEKKARNWSLNPFKALKHVGKKGLEILSMPLHIASKAAITISRPQDIFKRQYWKDIGTNIGKWAKSIAKTFTGLVYTKHREDTEYVNTNQAYGKTQWPSGINKPEAAVSSFGRTLGKLPKLASHIVAGTTGALANTLDSVRKGKADYGDTKLALSKVVSWNPKVQPSK